jgi:hypothetical protein
LLVCVLRDVLRAPSEPRLQISRLSPCDVFCCFTCIARCIAYREVKRVRKSPFRRVVTYFVIMHICRVSYVFPWVSQLLEPLRLVLQPPFGMDIALTKFPICQRETYFCDAYRVGKFPFVNVYRILVTPIALAKFPLVIV